jgi:hypothetical protein
MSIIFLEEEHYSNNILFALILVSVGIILINKNIKISKKK